MGFTDKQCILLTLAAGAFFSCVQSPKEVFLQGELILDERYVKECGSEEVYALLFPPSVAEDFADRVTADPEGAKSGLVAGFQGFVVSRPPGSNAHGSLAVLRIEEWASGSCPE